MDQDQATSLARLAGLLADRTRATICLALLDERAWTAGELARHAGVTAPTASEHLSLLIDAGLLQQQRQGRHRYVRLASPDVAQLVEDLAAFTETPARPATSLRAARDRDGLATARTCYDHLAGRLGVTLYERLAAGGLIDVRDGLSLTPRGRAWFADLGCDLDAGTSRRPVVRSCVDWTERRTHLAGRAGAALHAELLRRGWTRRGTVRRSIKVTPAGREGLRDLLGIDVEAWTA